MRDCLIGLVGKPSSGKSTMLNALTDANAKVGSFPFTTIEPNRAVGYVAVECACKRFGKENACRPSQGWCEGGKRYVPVALLDVAGLVPGAHEGKGLGNKFLDDLRHADSLIHVVDASGTTDAEGKAAKGYDPVGDVEWLQTEVFCWVKGNLMAKWGSIQRRHVATKATAVDTLANQFSGYGATRQIVHKALQKAAVRDSEGLAGWDDDEINEVVRAFVETKFPTVLALNKCDHPDSDRNVGRIAQRYANVPHVLTSAMSEVFLKRLVKQNYITYEAGSEFIETCDDGVEGLRPMDEKLKERVETVRDLVLYRFGSTGVEQVLQRAVDMLELIPVFPVRQMPTMGSTKAAFSDCLLIPRGTTLGKVAQRIVGDVPVAAIEGVSGRLSDEETVDLGRNDILSFRLGRPTSAATQSAK